MAEDEKEVPLADSDDEVNDQTLFCTYRMRPKVKSVRINRKKPNNADSMGVPLQLSMAPQRNQNAGQEVTWAAIQHPEESDDDDDDDESESESESDDDDEEIESDSVIEAEDVSLRLETTANTESQQ